MMRESYSQMVSQIAQAEHTRQEAILKRMYEDVAKNAPRYLRQLKELQNLESHNESGRLE